MDTVSAQLKKEWDIRKQVLNREYYTYYCLIDINNIITYMYEYIYENQHQLNTI